MKNEKSLATVVADAYDGLLAGINKMPPFTLFLHIKQQKIHIPPYILPLTHGLSTSIYPRKKPTLHILVIS